MPDILIRMEMPRSCDECPLADCYWACNSKSKHCPLRELPEHGDLIDVSKIVLEYGGLAKISPHDFVGIAKYFAKQIEGQPVIVPAERRESND